MKAFRIEYFIEIPGYPGGGIKRSKKIMAQSVGQATLIFNSSIGNASVRVVKTYEDNCKNCKKK